MLANSTAVYRDCRLSHWSLSVCFLGCGGNQNTPTKTQGEHSCTCCPRWELNPGAQHRKPPCYPTILKDQYYWREVLLGHISCCDAGQKSNTLHSIVWLSSPYNVVGCVSWIVWMENISKNVHSKFHKQMLKIYYISCIINNIFYIYPISVMFNNNF